MLFIASVLSKILIFILHPGSCYFQVACNFKMILPVHVGQIFYLVMDLALAFHGLATLQLLRDLLVDASVSLGTSEVFDTALPEPVLRLGLLGSPHDAQFPSHPTVPLHSIWLILRTRF